VQHGKREKKFNTKSAASSGVVRIIGGAHRGRKLHFYAVDGLRPTLDRVRETLFNWLQGELSHRHCLDLFAGSGALGFEALSRGARSVTLVEAHTKVANNLKKNVQLLGADNARVVNCTAEQFLKNNDDRFDLVFLDPPFAQKLLQVTLERLEPHLADGALIYIEQPRQQAEANDPTRWQVVKFKQTSQLSFGLYSLSKPA